MMAAAAGAGALLGLMLVHALNLMDSTLRSGEDVRKIAGLPCFALVPELSRRELRFAPIEEFVSRRPLSPFAEQIRAVRAGLWLGVERPKIVAITAARPSEGKSVLALSLARSAALSGEKVLLIDCDLRRPSLDRMLRAEGSKGLSDLLRGKAELEDVLHSDYLGARPNGSGKGADAFHGRSGGEPPEPLQTDRQSPRGLADDPATVSQGVQGVACISCRRERPRATRSECSWVRRWRCC